MITKRIALVNVLYFYICITLHNNYDCFANFSIKYRDVLLLLVRVLMEYTINKMLNMLLLCV